MHPIRTLTALLSSFVLFTEFACVQVRETDPVARADSSYFAGYTFQSKPVSSGQMRVMASMCDTNEPTNVEVSVYDFGPDTNGDEDLDLILYPGSVSISPSEVVLIQAKYIHAGAQLSDYDSEKRFAIGVARNGVSVLLVDKGDGTKRAGWVMTTGKVTSDVCLKNLSGRGGRINHQPSRR